MEKRYKYFNPEFYQLEGLPNRVNNACTKHFNRFKHKHVFFMEFNHQTLLRFDLHF